MSPLVVSLLLTAALPASTSAPASPFTQLTVYQGVWTVTPVVKPGATNKTDRLVNHCTVDEAFYTCEQVVNGKAVALVVFVPTDKPGSYTTQ